MADDLAQQLQTRWEQALHWYDDDDSWVGQALRPVIAAAAAIPQLRALFPFTSLNRLCFSRCSDYPYTIDCPCIAAKDGEYTVQAWWTASNEPPPELIFTTDLDRAIRTVTQNLPPNPSAWLGARDHQPH